MRLTASFVVLSLATLTLTAGCGGSASTPTVYSVGTTTNTSTTTGSAAPTTSAVNASQTVATVGFSFPSTGDHVEETFAVDPPTSFVSANPAVQSCAGFMTSDPSRAVVYHVVVTSKLTTSLGGTFTMDFGTPVPFPLAVQLSGGPHCWAAGIGDKLALTMTPGESIQTDVWMVGDGALTPANPTGDPVVLRRLKLAPSLFPGDNTESVQGDVTEAFGSRVLACNFDTTHTILAEIFADPTSFAKGDSGCAPAATRADFAALEREAGTMGITSP